MQGKIDAVVIDSAPATVFVEQGEGLRISVMRSIEPRRSTRSPLRRATPSS